MLPFLRLHPAAILPRRGTPGSAGLDLHSVGRILIPVGERRSIQTGWAVQIPHGWYGRVAPRSGLAQRNGIAVLAGVIDQDFRGEVCVILHNAGSDPFQVERGDRVAQLIIEACALLDPAEVVALPEPETLRGTGGFGSTGVGAEVW